MKKELVILSILLLVVPMLSAGIFDFFKSGPKESPVDVGVTLANTAPTMVTFIAVTENPDDVNGVTPAGDIQGVATGTVPVTFKFVVEDLNGLADLPGLTGPAITEGTNVAVTFTEPTNDATPGTNTISVVGGDCTAISCVANPDCTDQTAGTLQKEYSCDIDMNYYDPSSPNAGASAADRWTISATVQDVGLLSATANSGDLGFTTLADNYIFYYDIQGVSAAGPLNWANLDTGTDDQPSDLGIVLTNVGNIAIADESVTGQNLVENLVPANYIEVLAFSAGAALGAADAGACDAVGGGGAGIAGINLVDNVAQTVTVPLTFSADGSDTATIYFCAWDALSNGHIFGSPALTYISNSANSNQWDISFNS